MAPEIILCEWGYGHEAKCTNWSSRRMGQLLLDGWSSSVSVVRLPPNACVQLRGERKRRASVLSVDVNNDEAEVM